MTARPSDSGHEDDAADTPLPIVGVGASAGGIEALKAFFDGLPPTPNMAFVVLIHLSPDHESNLVPILQRHTGLAVEETTDGAVPEANTVTVLPPRSRLRIADGQLRLDEEVIEPGPPSVIDTFFRSLADDQAEAAIGVLLSGTGTDGTLGLRALKERGAFAMAQSPDDAAYGGMPRNAVETGLVDVVDDADELGSKLPEYWAQATKPAPIPDQEVDSENVLRKIFDRLYAETGHDFSGYKRSTIRRRLRRRMAAQQVPTLSAYLEALQDPQEAQALFREFLISVTSFFRDPDDIEALGELVVPDLFDGKGRDDQVRVWVAGCASGEEAYSLAILLDEYAQSHQPRPDIQIFGTDPNAPSIEHAREGHYPKSIAADVSDERLNRYFRPEGKYYRVIPPLRKMVIFAEHDLLEDPPFSRIDLVSCRNVLIYLQRSIHAQVLRLFHYGLRSGGYLFLGPSESPSGAPDLFSPLDDCTALYRRQAIAQQSNKTVPVPHTSDLAEYQPSLTPSRKDQPPSSPESLGDLHEQALLDDAASLLVNENGDIVHTTEPATSYLSYQGGSPSHNFLDAAPKPIRLELRGALRRVFQENESTGPTVIESRPGDAPQPYLLRVRPLDRDQDEDRLAQVRLERIAPRPPANEAEATDAQRVEQLENELAEAKQQLQNTIEESETTTEELESSNEELLSMNEELQLKNEEIETSKEELQSVNEELKNTNQELKAKIQELKKTNSDLRNLMQATTVATLFLDRDLCIEWFTPRVRDHFSIREADTGRPLSDLTKHMEYDGLLDDAQIVLDSLEAFEQEIQNDDGRWLLVRMRPYRTVDDEVDGVVVTFVDITDRKQAELKVREERNFVESLLDTVGALIVVLDTEHQIVRFNQKCEAVTGYSADEVTGESVFERLVPKEEAEDVRDLLDASREDPAPDPHEYHWITREGNRRLIRWSNTNLTADDGTLQYIIGTGVDITRRRQLEREVIGVSDKQRRRIGEDLHDILASHLSGTAMMTKGLARKIKDGQEIEAAKVREISDLIQDAGEQARKLSHSLMPLEVHGDDLLEGFENLARRKEKMTDVTFTVETHESLPALDPDIVSHLYRIASEAVNNAIKHGAPSRVDLRLRMEDDRLSLVVKDDGVGIPEDIPDGDTLGLNMIRYRADLIGARLTIDSGEDGGTVVTCSMPITHSSKSPRPVEEAPSS